MAATTQSSSPPSHFRNCNASSSEEDYFPPPSPFLDAFLTASPFASELLSILCTPTKQNLFATCRALSTYRDSCYAWNSVQLTKYGYKPATSFAKINYQIQARLIAPARYSPIPEEFANGGSGNGAVVPVEKYFCPGLDSAKVWDMFSVRPAFGTVLKELVVDGTGVDIGLVKKVLAVCAVSGKGLKKLSIRYCDKIKLDDIVELLPKVREESHEPEDSGYSSEEVEYEDDSLLKTLNELQLYGIRDLHLTIQDPRSWLVKIDRLLKYTAEKKLTVDVNWCSRTLSGPKKRLRRPHCHGGRDLPFLKILPLADTGSLREKRCMGCKKGPEQIGWHCDSCLKEVMCECCGTFFCDSCDPKRSRLVKCGDCPARRCGDCFTQNGGSRCESSSCDHKATCGEHNFDIKCDHCPETKTVNCSACNPATKCGKCSTWMWSHCDGNTKNGEKKEGAFNCDCDFQMCHGCAEDAKNKFIDSNTTDGSLEDLVYSIDSAEFPIVPKQFASLTDEEMLGNDNWCCFYCRIMPRRKYRYTDQQSRQMSKSRMRVH